MQRCGDCDRFVWYPRARCPHCWSESLIWTPMSGRATVYAVSVHRRSTAPHLADRAPYAVVLVDLDEGVRMMSAVLDGTPSVGDPLVLTWFDLDDGRKLPVFTTGEEERTA